MSDQSKFINDEGIISDIATESIAIGMIADNPTLLDEHMEHISAKYDFSNDEMKFLYKTLAVTYLSHSVVDETSINIEVSKMSDNERNLYSSLKGYSVYNNLIKISKVDKDFKKVYTKLKAFNTMRRLQKSGINIAKYLDKFVDKDSEEILKSYEALLTNISSSIKNINDSVRIGDDIVDLYEKYKEDPDYGIDLPFPILNSLTRGWRTSKVYASAMHSGFGKSRQAAFIATHISIIGQTPILIAANEQEKAEIDLMILTCVANNIFSDKYGVMVEETEIAMGMCTGKKDEMCREAAQYIKDRSKIMFLELNAWDLNTLKTIVKKHKLRGINYMIIDTFKAMRGVDTQGLNDWQSFVYTAEKLKEIIGSTESGGVNVGLWLTMQMTDDSLMTKSMSSSSLATGKQAKHHLDLLIMTRALDYKEKGKFKVKINIPGNPFNNQNQALDKNKDYYMTFVDKNRGGKDKQYIVYEIDKGKMLWKELGFAIFNSDEDESEIENKFTST